MELNNIGMVYQFHNLNFPEHFLQIIFIELSFINNFDSYLK